MPETAPRRLPGSSRRAREIALNLLPGLLAGAQLAGLLLFLNPDIPFDWFRFFRASAVLGLLLGVVSASGLTFYTWRRPGAAQRILPWAIIAVLATAALADWIQASFLAFYTPPGINIRLIKAAGLLSFAAVVLFYTALLHSFPPRRYGRRSILLFLVISLASVYALGERREAYRPRLQSAPLPSLVELEEGPALFVVGLEGATLDAILPLVQEGQLPFFGQIVEGGVHARLEPLSPIMRSALWTSLATGKFPYKHGVLSETSLRVGFLPGKPRLTLLPWGLPLPDRLMPGFRRARPDATSRRGLALWEIYSRLSLRTGVVSWPSLYPVTETSAFTFSERYFAGNFSAPAALPPELAERGILFQIGQNELGPGPLAAFTDAPPEVLSALAGDVWRESLAQFLLEQRQDLRRFFILLPGLGEVSTRYLGGFSAFEHEGIRNERRRTAAHLVTAYYRHLDSYLADLWERQDGPKLMAIVSPFGAQSPEGWRRVWFATTGRSDEGSFSPANDGVLFLMGEGVKQGHFLERASLLDVMPTLLYATQLPISRELDGQVLVDAFSAPFLAQTPLNFVPSYETLVGQPPSMVEEDLSSSSATAAE
ncbi:MAG: alkaline phosphatase family protein [bacterium]|nr:alkaline phosphatase family protein [bacterium]